MVILITGASHTGKTLLAQRLMEKHRWPYFSIDHLKMGLIRSGHTDLTPEDDDALTVFLWPIVREMIKTAVENRQNLIVEGCYVPFDWRRELSGEYLKDIRFICLAMSEQYIASHFGEIVGHASEIETRLVDPGVSIDSLVKDNRKYMQGFRQCGEQVTVIDSDYEQALKELLEQKLG